MFFSAAGVSPITVSRVMRNGTNVRPETRELVLRAASELNYVPNAVARSLRQSRSGLLALVITDMMNPFFHTIARGAEDAAQAAGMAIVLGNSDDDPALEAKYLQVMAEHRVDGIILVTTPETTADRIPLLPPNAPLVLLDRRPPDLEANLVSCDTATATRDLCRHLFALGHERIAIVGGMPELQTWQNRLAGYRQAQREADLGQAPPFQAQPPFAGERQTLEPAVGKAEVEAGALRQACSGQLGVGLEVEVEARGGRGRQQRARIDGAQAGVEGEPA